MEGLKSAALRFEELLERFGSPLKPYLPALGRFFLVVTFYEDAFRIIFQWNDQVNFFINYRRFSWFFTVLFLALNVLLMLACSTLALMRKHSEAAVGGLALVIVSQAIGYGMWLSLSFVFRNISLIGGLILMLSESVKLKSKAQNGFPGLPELNQNDSATYLTLLGRVLLIFLFLSVAFGGEDFGIVRLVFSLVALVVCVMVVVGFKAKYSAMILLAILSIFNIIVNNWWSLHADHPRRDFMKYDFFQTLSVMGGLLMLINVGPGGISIDEKKKQF